MPKLFRSSAQYIQRPLDCRRLTLSMDFYLLRKEQVIEMTRMIMQWVNRFTDKQFVFRCNCNTSSVNQKFLFQKMVDAINKDNNLDIGYDAYVISPIITNMSSMRTFQSRVKTIHPVYMFNWDADPDALNVSIDFPRYFDKRFPIERPENDLIINLIHQVFCEEGKVYRTLHVWPDLRGGARADPYESNPELFYGSMYISFSAFCLGDFINEVADFLMHFAQEVSSIFVNLNAHISLQPAEIGVTGYRSPYMKYFGRRIKPDGSHKENGYTIQEWYPTYYLCGVEWFNLLSPLVASHIDSNLLCNYGKMVDIHILSWGSTILKSSKMITDYDIHDALELKRMLKPVLYPGTSYSTLRGIFPWQNTRRIYGWCPRCNWEIVPIEKHEIEIVGSDLVFDVTHPTLAVVNKDL